MRDSDTSLAIALIAVCGFVPLSAAAGALQTGNAGPASTIACSNQTTRIDGVGQRVRLTGDCRTVVVSGSGNRVVVERVGSLNVSGMDNEVRWERSLEGDAPRVVTSGIKNVVMRATPAATSVPARVPRHPRSLGTRHAAAARPRAPRRQRSPRSLHKGKRPPGRVAKRPNPAASTVRRGR